MPRLKHQTWDRKARTFTPEGSWDRIPIGLDTAVDDSSRLAFAALSIASMMFTFMALAIFAGLAVAFGVALGMAKRLVGVAG